MAKAEFMLNKKKIILEMDNYPFSLVGIKSSIFFWTLGPLVNLNIPRAYAKPSVYNDICNNVNDSLMYSGTII